MIWPKRENVRSTGIPAKKEALAKGDIAPVLMRIKPENETEVRGAFKKALAVRGKGAEAKGLADTYFFEPPVAAADKALGTGEVDELVKLVTEKVADGIRDRFRFIRHLKASEMWRARMGSVPSSLDPVLF